ncbi:hypothetical protein GWK47_048923 [Chionoecetes opilio]|uniref:Uncharacterized protein n=1 Tax=Chionoecetes opilio TaxID=41210 RepID=A0A8J5CFG7_CHIOP|nr:hypothetical protein GWK47_048923 [Chionoecetes opilio]
MATDTKDARMPPAASRYCYCVCDKKRRKHPGVRLQLFPKDARSAISISGDWARCGSRGGQLYHYYRKYGTQCLWVVKGLDCFVARLGHALTPTYAGGREVFNCLHTRPISSPARSRLLSARTGLLKELNAASK